MTQTTESIMFSEHCLHPILRHKDASKKIKTSILHTSTIVNVSILIEVGCGMSELVCSPVWPLIASSHKQVCANDDVNNPLTHSLTSLTWGEPGADSRKMREIDKKK